MSDRLFSNPLIEVDPLSLMKLWGELVEAYHGVNGFGGNIAEISCYRFSPLHQGACQLVALIEEFIGHYDCEVTIDNIPYKDWLRNISSSLDKFDHRVHVTVERKDGEI